MTREGFLDRWSRRKLEGEEAPGEAAAPAAEPAPAVEDDRSDEEILADLDLPHPDTLKPGDDVKRFMDAAVPDRLRRMALRQLWRSNPVLANIDGLVEYGEDYTDAATVVENLQTVYQVGKGMWPELREEQPETAAEEDETIAEAEAAAAEHPALQSAEAEDDLAEREPGTQEPPADQPEDVVSEVAPTRRRMTFTLSTG